MPPSDAAPAPATPGPGTPPAAPPVAPVAPPAGVGAAAAGSAAPAPPPAPEPAPSEMPPSLLDMPKDPEPAPEPATPPEPIDPASYEVKLPEGMTRDDPMVAAFLESAAGRRMDAESVQAVLDKVAPLVAEQLAAPQRTWATLNAEWQAAVKADPDIGGGKLPATIERVTRAIDQFGTPELKDALRLTGAINNPHILKFVNKLCEPYAEGTPAPAGNSGHVAPPPGRALAALYPSAAAPSGA